MQDSLGKAGRLTFPVAMLAYPFYLWKRSPGKEGSHYDPKCDLFTPAEEPLVSSHTSCALLAETCCSFYRLLDIPLSAPHDRLHAGASRREDSAYPQCSDVTGNSQGNAKPGSRSTQCCWGADICLLHSGRTVQYLAGNLTGMLAV